ncbi:hypothetical protein DFH09DRAFT_204846 [Mycena vulgaris]|nr:hypothetical protein DFH09DRAFT_204846 [Mycena vulgaris]
MEQGDDSLALTRLNTLHVSPRQSGALVQSPAAFIGPGKTLHEIYSSLGAMAEKHANRAAHSLGMGPIAVGERLSTHFGDGGEREEALSGLRTNIPRKLAKDCARLMAYALPCETLTTQLEAFKSLITVITRYPGTRMILLDSKPPAGEEGDIAGLWDHPSEVCDREWAFHRKFAAACLADRDISSVVEAVEPQQLGSVSEHLAGLSIIERLLVFSDSDGQSHFSHQIAIRYLGGILELPSFWLQAGALHRTVVQKILARALLLLKDLGVDSPALDNSTAGVLDIDGTDILCDALLQGIQAWLPERFSPAITPETWYPSLYNVLQQLRQPRTEDLLPRSWAIATGGRLQEVVPSHYESRLVYMITTAPVCVHLRFLLQRVEYLHSASGDLLMGIICLNASTLRPGRRRTRMPPATRN